MITSSLNVAFFLSSELFFHPRFLSFLREIKQSRRIRIAEHSAFIVADQIDDTLSAEFANNLGQSRVQNTALTAALGSAAPPKSAATLVFLLPFQGRC